MREPRVATGKRTMLYMAVSLALTAAGILIGYLLLNVQHTPGKTMNAILSERVFGAWTLGNLPAGYWLVLVTLISEGLLLLVAAQAGFIDGPRVMANMAVDSYLPHRFAALSEQLSMQNGVLLMGLAALAMLAYTRGNIQTLVYMYSINVFLTFSLSQLGMTRFWKARRREKTRRRHLAIHGVALVLCVGILGLTVFERFTHGGWVTVVLTSLFVVLCYAIHGHYQRAQEGLKQLDDILGSLPPTGEARSQTPRSLDPKAPTAVLLVSSYSGFGVHTLLSILRYFPGLYKQFIFVSVAVVDSGSFKGKEEIEALQQHTEEDLEKYVEVAAPDGLRGRLRLERRHGGRLRGFNPLPADREDVPQGHHLHGQARFPPRALLLRPPAQRDLEDHPAPPAVGGRADGGAAHPGAGVNQPRTNTDRHGRTPGCSESPCPSVSVCARPCQADSPSRAATQGRPYSISARNLYPTQGSVPM